MAKINIKLSNGEMSEVEVTMAELLTLMNGVPEKTTKVKVPATVYVATTTKAKRGPRGPYKATVTKGYPKSLRQWTQRDIVEIGKIILGGLDDHSGLSKAVRSYVKSRADVRKRSDATIYTMTSDIKGYLRTGNVDRIPNKTKVALDEANIFPPSVRRSTLKDLLPSIKEVQEA